MKIVVEKYGGSSLCSTERIKAVARRVVARQEQGYQVVVIVSAMGDTTDDLLSMVGELTPAPRQRELGMLLSTGEVVSCSLMAMAIHSLGKKATALTGPQSGIITNGKHDNARIAGINTDRIKKHLSKGEIVVVAGYQGKLEEEIAVLGRGGSDASAVALAASLQAENCYVYSDVPGVFTADPRIVPDASLLPRISYEEMIELAGAGAQIMMGRSVEIARKYGLKVFVGSSHNNSPGTLITRKEHHVEKLQLTGIAAKKDVAVIEINSPKTTPDTSIRILDEIARQHINIVLLTSDRMQLSTAYFSIVVKADDVEAVNEILEKLSQRSVIDRYRIRSNVAQVSVVGYGIAENYGVAYEVFDTLSQNGIDILLTSTSEIKISVIVPEEHAALSVIKLHEQFELNGERHLQIQ